MEEITLLKDFAVIMIVAGAVTLLFRLLRQPPILGYLIAGLLAGPYILPVPPVTDLHTIKLLADLGLVLLLFGLGLEFSWSKIREIGLVVLFIGIIEILAMICFGYGLGKLLGWSRIDAIFLGAAMHVSSTVIIMKILRDLGRIEFLSSRIIMGILVVEDFAAVVIITILSGIATTGIANIGSVGFLVLKLGIFIAASLGLGALVVPRIMGFVHRFHSKEVLLITSLALCFGMAILGEYLGLSVAAGAFLMGALIGDTKHSEEVAEVVAPVRDMFAAIFFVAIGMLIDISQFRHFLIPALIVACVFMVGKILVNTLATFMCGYDGRTALQVGMGKAQMGEFSLAIARVGIDRVVVVAPLYPVIATATALTSLAAPYMIRSVNSVADFFSSKAPTIVREYIIDLSDWLQALRGTYSRKSKVSDTVKKTTKAILIDLTILVVVIGTGTFVLQFAESFARYIHLREDLVAALFGLIVIVLCLPPIVLMWRNIRSLIDTVASRVLRRRATAKEWKQATIRAVLRDSVVIILSVSLLVWFIPFISRLFFFGSLAVTIPFVLIAIILYFTLISVRHIHNQLSRTFGHVIFGEELASTFDKAAPQDIDQSETVTFVDKMKLFIQRPFRLMYKRADKPQPSTLTPDDEKLETTDRTS